jgi:lipopolysaccharide transport system ATP-binding protein
MTSKGQQAREPVISVRGLGKCYRIWTHAKPTSLSDRVESLLYLARARRRGHETRHLREEIWALRDVSFDVRRGEVLGVIGPNGAGKSTLLSILARITEPTEGEARISGRVSSILEVGTGFHPELSGRDNVFLNGTILGMSRAEVAAKFDEIVDFSGVSDFIDMPVKRYSSGMYVRLAFAVTAHLDPDVLLLDEVLAVGDRGFQEKCFERVREMTAAQRTVVFVSHDVGAVERLCGRAIVIDEGRIAFSGPVHAAVEHYLQAVSPELAETAQSAHHGTGKARIEAVKVENDSGSDGVLASEPISISADLDAAAVLATDGLNLELQISDAIGTPLVVLTKDLSGEPALDPGRGRTTVTCRLQELPLRPGAYTVSATLSRKEETLDRAPKLGRFRIVASDFFGTGELTRDDHPGPVLARHDWIVEVGEASEVESPTAS